jgi:hypothetical protein
MIVESKWKCKNGSSIWQSDGVKNNRFIKDKWYTVFYETWSFNDGYRLNNGWLNYWAVNEFGIKEKLSKAKARLIFYHDSDEQRDAKIEEIIK